MEPGSIDYVIVRENTEGLYASAVTTALSSGALHVDRTGAVTGGTRAVTAAVLACSPWG